LRSLSFSLFLHTAHAVIIHLQNTATNQPADGRKPPHSRSGGFRSCQGGRGASEGAGSFCRRRPVPNRVGWSTPHPHTHHIYTCLHTKPNKYPTFSQPNKQTTSNSKQTSKQATNNNRVFLDAREVVLPAENLEPILESRAEAEKLMARALQEQEDGMMWC